jgi:hypothetical protein
MVNSSFKHVINAKDRDENTWEVSKDKIGKGANHCACHLLIAIADRAA